MNKTAVAFHLMKGGVGKTTLSMTMAAEFALMGKRTVIVDCDIQGNSSSWLLEGSIEPEYELADALLERCEPNEVVTRYSELLSIVPTFGLTETLSDFARSGLGSAPYAVADLVESIDADVVVLDLGPGMGNLERAALLATSEIVLTMTPEFFSLDGLEVWAGQAKALEKGLRTKLKYERLVINGINRTIEQMVRVTDEARQAASTVYTIAQDPVFRKAQEAHVLPQELAMKPENRRELRRLAEELLDGDR